MADTRTPEEIERDIEQERANLSGTLNSLQDRFSVEGAVRQVSDHLKDNGGEIAQNVAQSVKQNPLGVALVGAGLAWLAFGNNRSQSGNSGTTLPQPVSPQPAPVPATTSTGRALENHSSPATAEGFGASAATRPNSGYGTHATRPNAYGAPVARHHGLSDDDPDLDWYYDDLDDDDHDGMMTRAGDAASAAAGSLHGAASGAADSARSAGRSVAEGGKSAAGSVRDGASSAAGSVKDGASSAAGAVKGGVQSAGASVASGARSVRDGAQSAADAAAENAERLRRRLAQGTETLSEEARERVIRARRAALKARDASADYGRNAARHSAEMYDRQPLVFGALAFAIGAAAAATLPNTRREDEMAGETSDRLIRRAQRIFEEEKSRAESVANAVADEAREIGKDAKAEIDDSAPGDKDAVDAAADKAKDATKTAAQRLADTAKDEADKQDLGKSVKQG